MTARFPQHLQQEEFRCLVLLSHAACSTAHGPADPSLMCPATNHLSPAASFPSNSASTTSMACSSSPASAPWPAQSQPSQQQQQRQRQRQLLQHTTHPQPPQPHQQWHRSVDNARARPRRCCWTSSLRRGCCPSSCLPSWLLQLRTKVAGGPPTSSSQMRGARWATGGGGSVQQQQGSLNSNQQNTLCLHALCLLSVSLNMFYWL
jgi:hypothetical protein